MHGVVVQAVRLPVQAVLRWLGTSLSGWLGRSATCGAFSTVPSGSCSSEAAAQQVVTAGSTPSRCRRRRRGSGGAIISEHRFVPVGIELAAAGGRCPHVN